MLHHRIAPRRLAVLQVPLVDERNHALVARSRANLEEERRGGGGGEIIFFFGIVSAERYYREEERREKKIKL